MRGNNSPLVLVVAGLDPSGGAGLVADVRTCAAFGIHALGLVSAETAQNASGVRHVWPRATPPFRLQLEALLEEFQPVATKIGLAGSPGQLALLARLARARQLGTVVLDPVLVASRGQSLVDERLRKAIDRLLPSVDVLTPNRPELAALTDRPTGTIRQTRDAARALLDRGVGAVFCKGGHARGPTVVDELVDAAGITTIERPRLPLGRSHGTGCHVSSAIAALLACGMPLPEACTRAVDWTREAIVAGFDAGPLAVRYLDDAIKPSRRTPASPRRTASNR